LANLFLAEPVYYMAGRLPTCTVSKCTLICIFLH
jgi:hypothetical protein